jgi:4-hydroxybenzoate polyprenyltransferase/phosphoserine phosphatase
MDPKNRDFSPRLAVKKTPSRDSAPFGAEAKMNDSSDSSSRGHLRAINDGGARPLVVDLDQTLVRANLLIESFFARLRGNPIVVATVLRSLLKGQARFKADIARETSIDITSLPYSSEVVAMIQEARDSGREVYLVSENNVRYVGAVAKHLGLFDGWFGSDDVRNLSGKAKADLLIERFGAHGFDYVGNRRADIPVWSVARHRVAVGANARVIAALRSLDPSARALSARGDGLKTWLRLFRIHQWAKNGLVFVPVLSAHLFTIDALTSAAAAAITFSLAASGVYIVNDLIDLDSDRNHRSKKNRPLAAGTVPAGEALAFALAFLVMAFAIGCLLPIAFVAVLVAYIATTTAYSFYLKRKLMLDVVALASLYTLRVIGGAAAVSNIPSEWILAFSMFIFTSLALLKRYVELTARLDGSLPDLTNRDYKKGDLPVLGALSAAAGLNAVTIFALYISSDTVHRLYRYPAALWLVCPILVYWVGRAIVLAERRLIDEDPILFALRDRVSLIAFVVIAFIMIAAA